MIVVHLEEVQHDVSEETEIFECGCAEGIGDDVAEDNEEWHEWLVEKLPKERSVIQMKRS